MARYIDADALYRRVKEKTNPYGKPTLDYESGVKVLNMIEQTPTADVVEVVRCKDCVYFVPKHIKLNDGTTRPYTDEEKKLPCGVTMDTGINVGSYCLRKGYWEQNGIPVWFGENDFCSYGERRDT